MGTLRQAYILPLDLEIYQFIYIRVERRTEKVCKRVAASEEFPEDVLWVAECERFMEMVSIVEMTP